MVNIFSTFPSSLEVSRVTLSGQETQINKWIHVSSEDVVVWSSHTLSAQEGTLSTEHSQTEQIAFSLDTALISFLHGNILIKASQVHVRQTSSVFSCFGFAVMVWSKNALANKTGSAPWPLEMRCNCRVCCCPTWGNRSPDINRSRHGLHISLVLKVTWDGCSLKKNKNKQTRNWFAQL